jgi:hypothetical protein
MTFFRDYATSKWEKDEQKARWLGREVEKVLSQYDSIGEAEEAVRLRAGMKPTRPTRPRYIFPPEE